MKLSTTFVIAIVLAGAALCPAEKFTWQEDQAIVTETGAIKWDPRPFVDDLTGQDVRYIDFEAGDDANDGKTPETAWKHHPWDAFAEGNAAKCSGPVTYVFKRGVVYRNPLKAMESGREDKPIRLTSTADWGSGEAALAGSIRLPAQWVRADKTRFDKPKYMKELDKIWVLELSALPWWNNGRPGYKAAAIGADNFHLNRGTFSVPFAGLFKVESDGEGTMLHLARNPDWQPAGNEFAHDYWPSWDGDGSPLKNEDGETYFKRIGPYKGPAVDADLKGKPRDYFTGAIIWSTYPSLMGSATPSDPLPATVSRRNSDLSGPAYDPEQGALAILQFHGFSRGTRYKIENLPQYLDTTGEFYLDHDRKAKDKPALLYYRPAPEVDPNREHLEMVANYGNIHIGDASWIEISGLSFRYTGRNAVALQGQCEDITIRNCVFSDLTKNAIVLDLKTDKTAWLRKKWNDPKEWKLELPNNIVIADSHFTDIWDQTISLESGGGGFGTASWPFGHLRHVEVLRNYIENVGIRHSGMRFAAIPAIAVRKAETGIIAGNVIKRSFGSGIMVFGGRTHGYPGSDWPLTRILIYHNSTEDTALAINDYGGFSLWQGGLMYAYNNNIGNSVGYMPGGIFGSGRPTTLSYPYYIDGGYKIYGFNNIVWDRSADQDDPYASRTAGYFSVFGFLNHFANNTVYRHFRGTGGSSGNRTDIVSNVFAEITGQFLKNNRVENPSLVGGGDTGASGVAGIPSLAYGRNIFHGSAIAGSLVETNERKGVFVKQNIAADTIEQMRQQMQGFPVRYGQLGSKVGKLPIVGETKPDGLTDEGAFGADFRLTPDSPAIDAGAKYFIPWSLAANVGEWNFTENHADPTIVTDYALYMDESHYDRFMYAMLPTLSLNINEASLEDYVPSPSEDWVRGALTFDGKRFASVTDSEMRADVEIVITQFITGRGQQTWKKFEQWPKELWSFPEPEGGHKDGRPQFGPEQTARYPGQRRNTLISTTRNLLLEAKFKTDPGHTGGTLMAKHDGKSGYALKINEAGKAEFVISAGGSHSKVASASKINDGKWHHVLAEIDRKAGRMVLYVDGKTSAQANAALTPDTSIDCKADFTVGKSSAGDEGYLEGAIDFMRVCHATLADARTSIEELYAWQYVNGPALSDMRGRPAKGKRRDAGALERQ